VASAIHLAKTDPGEFITQSLLSGRVLMAGNNDEVYDNKSQRYAKDNVSKPK